MKTFRVFALVVQIVGLLAALTGCNSSHSSAEDAVRRGTNTRDGTMVILPGSPCAATSQPTCDEVVKDGSFEEASFRAGSYTSATNGMLLDGGNWTVATDRTKAGNSEAGVGIVNDYNALFYPTLSGCNFVYLGYYATGPTTRPDGTPVGGNQPQYPLCSISQKITLQSDRHYTLSFLESAYRFAGDATAGSVTVALIPATPGPTAKTITHTYTVPAFSGWAPRGDDIYIPVGAGGNYTIVFSNSANLVAVIDAVSLCGR